MQFEGDGGFFHFAEMWGYVRLLAHKPCASVRGFPLQLTDDVSWAKTLVNNIREQCVTYVSSQVTLWFTAEGQYQQPKVINAACPGDCNGNGLCMAGQHTSP